MNYKKIYADLITRAQNSNRTKNSKEYFEIHHIVPKALGGDGKLHEWRTHPNLVLLTAKEHFLAHRLLICMYPEGSYEYKKMIYALSFFLGTSEKHKRYKISSKTYDYIKQQLAKVKRNVPRTEETRKKIKETKKLNPWHPSEELRKQWSNSKKGEKNPMYGKAHTEESKRKVSEARKGKPNLKTSLSNKARIGKKLTYTREIQQYTLEGVLVAEYVSIKEAVRQTGVGSIICVLRKHQKTAGGFTWKYKE